jgi:hypothetical protein
VSISLWYMISCARALPRSNEAASNYECNLEPGYRHCHRRKQASGWKLEQPAPGLMIWTSPAGRRYVTYPSKHPT